MGLLKCCWAVWPAVEVDVLSQFEATLIFNNVQMHLQEICVDTRLLEQGFPARLGLRSAFFKCSVLVF